LIAILSADWFVLGLRDQKQGQLVGDAKHHFKETKSNELLNSMCEFMCESFSKISKNRKKQENIG
jgi:hypothetical protein